MNTQTISRSIVLIENQFKGIMPIGNFQFQINNNPFQELASVGLLKRVVKDICKKDINYIQNNNNDNLQIPVKSFNFNNEIIFTYEAFPPKFVIHCNTNSDNTVLINNLFKELIKDNEDLQRKISAIGINFELFINDKTLNINDKIFQDNVKNELTDMSVSLKYNINGIITTIQIANAIKNDLEGLYFNINFHNEIGDLTEIDSLLNQNFLQIGKNKIDNILK